MSIANRIFLLISISSSALLVVAGLMIVNCWQTSNSMSRLATSRLVIDDLAGLTSSLQRERGRTAQFLSSGGTRNGPELDEQRRTSDGLRDSVMRLTEDGPRAALDDDVVTGLKRVGPTLQTLPALRDAVSHQSLAPAAATAAYSDIVAPLLDVTLLVVRGANDPDVKNIAFALTLIQAAGERIGLVRAAGVSAIAAGQMTKDLSDRLLTLSSSADDFLTMFATYAPADVLASYRTALQAPEAAEFDRLRRQIAGAAPGMAVSGVDGAAWFKAATGRVDLLKTVADGLLVRMALHVEAKRQAATLSLAAAITALIVLLAIVLGLGFRTMRAISKPVDAMVEAMTRLAQGDHDIEVPAQGRSDEIGAMAKAVLVFRAASIEKVRRDAEIEAERLRNAEERQRAERVAIEGERALVTQSVGQALSGLAAKDLTCRLGDSLPDAYAQLRIDFNRAMEQLQQAIGTVSDTTVAIHAGTREIASASDDLSQRTERQAASLEETAAALDQITATVRKSADGAQQARGAVDVAAHEAERSANVVRQAIAAMSQIESSSTQITQIIGVIDEIAFQTNLLALNAGVEAARAGEAGRGFAVVASEVRGLAQRSAEAAKEIKALISTSAKQVGEGVDLVGATGRTLDEIQAQIAAINGVIGQMATASLEQSTALDEVNAAVNSMDQMTQQNAAMAEEATAASQALQGRSEALAELVGTFRVGAAARLSPKPGLTMPAPRAAFASVHRGSVATAMRVAAEDAWDEF